MRRFLISLLGFCFLASGSQARSLPWTEQHAAERYARQPWLVGSNYIPATDINQLEMWQAETFDPQRIDLEFGWAEFRRDGQPYRQEEADLIRRLTAPAGDPE